MTHDVGDFIEASLRELQLCAHSLVTKADVLPHCCFRGLQEGHTEQLNELILEVLDEVEARIAVAIHYEDGQMSVRLLDRVIQRTCHHVRIVSELDHQALLFSHSPKCALVENV
jgi:hypothetical protein